MSSSQLDKQLVTVPLVDNNEQLISVKELADNHSVTIQITCGEDAYLRENVAVSFIKAAADFHKMGYVLQLRSAYRSLSQQRSKFIQRHQELKNKTPQASKEALIEEANTYTAGIPILAAHTAGAAVDVMLLDQNGVELDFGVPFGYGGEESSTEHVGLSEEARRNRQILKDGMSRHGFTNYPFEFWHYSIGDVCATYLSGKKSAIYGPVEFNPKLSDIQQPIASDSMYKFFEI